MEFIDIYLTGCFVSLIVWGGMYAYTVYLIGKDRIKEEVKDPKISFENLVFVMCVFIFLFSWVSFVWIIKDYIKKSE